MVGFFREIAGRFKTAEKRTTECTWSARRDLARSYRGFVPLMPRTGGCRLIYWLQSEMVVHEGWQPNVDKPQEENHRIMEFGLSFNKNIFISFD
jgi:hypothetical protein